MDTKLQELTQLELARTDFQSNVSALIEIYNELSNKVNFAKSQKKEYISHHVDEAEIISGHLMTVLTGLCGSYDVINHTSKLLILQNNVLRKESDQLVSKLVGS